MHCALTDATLDVPRVLAAVADGANGATAVFVGTVRSSNDGRDVTGIDYSAYEAMAEREIRSIASEASTTFSQARIAVEHRLGTLAVGEISIVVAAAHPHRGPALDAMRFAIEQIKRRVPIWKREHYSDGTRAWVDPGGIELR